MIEAVQLPQFKKFNFFHSSFYLQWIRLSPLWSYIWTLIARGRSQTTFTRRSEYLGKVRFSYQCNDHLSHSKNFTSLFPLTFLSKPISLYALGRIRWILDIIWHLNQHFKLKNQRNWLKQVWMLKFWSVINCFFMHWTKKLTSVLRLATFRVFFKMNW